MLTSTGEPGDVALRGEGLRKTFGEVRAVDGVSLALPAGETTGLLGPNGAGKTTLLRLLTGVLQPDAGRVALADGGSPHDRSVRRTFGVAPQATSLYDELTGAENLRFCGRLYDLSGARLEERVGRCLAFAGLQERADDPVGDYSGGMQRRLSLACALVHDPEILFLDEPTLGVDPQSRTHIFEKVGELQRQGRTVLYTTHDMEAAERMCDRVAIMDEGRILARDSVEGLLETHGGGTVVRVELAAPPPDPGELPGTVDGTSLRVEGRPARDVLGALEATGTGYRSVTIEEPGLESVFLSLTGRALRE